MCNNPNCKYKYQCNCNDCSCSPNTDGEKGLCKCCKDIMVAGLVRKENDS